MSHIVGQHIVECIVVLALVEEYTEKLVVAAGVVVDVGIIHIPDPQSMFLIIFQYIVADGGKIRIEVHATFSCTSAEVVLDCVINSVAVYSV